MSWRSVPPGVRAHLFLFWAGMAVSGLGIVGFFLSYGEVASPSQAAIAVHTDIPVHAYASIFAWVGGLIVMRFSRKSLDAAVKAKKRESQEALLAGLDPESAAPEPAAGDAAPTDAPIVDAPDGREA